jgi:hypothetical protein
MSRLWPALALNHHLQLNSKARFSRKIMLCSSSKSAFIVSLSSQLGAKTDLLHSIIKNPAQLDIPSRMVPPQLATPAPFAFVRRLTCVLTDNEELPSAQPEEQDNPEGQDQGSDQASDPGQGQGEHEEQDDDGTNLKTEGFVHVPAGGM